MTVLIIILCIIGVIAIAGIITFIISIRQSKDIDPNEPFLDGEDEYV